MIKLAVLALLSLYHVQCREIINSREFYISKDSNDSPIIGVLAQEISYYFNKKWPEAYSSYIAASYIKFVEGGGARAVPIWIGKPREYYEEIMSKVNGVLFPGGATWFNQTNGYAAAGKHIYDIAQQLNENGVYMPIFGTCLGFELLLYVSNENREYRTKCSSEKQALPLEFTDNFRNSKLFNEAPSDVIDILANEPVTANFHSWCLTEKNFTGYNFNQDWDVLSWNKDFNGLKFASTIEHKKYPFFGVQFHPEKVVYEWVAKRNIPHTANAVKANQYFERFFVNQCRQNGNRFSSIDEENRVLIYNYPATFTGLVKSVFEQSYLFADNAGYRNESKSNEAVGLISMNEILFGMVFTIITINL